MQNETKKWLAQAKHDLSNAQFNFDGDRFDLAAFLCQQAAEKALKAVYIKKHKALRKTHDLVLLGREVGLPENMLQYCKELTPAYTYTRYPDIIEMENIAELAKIFLRYSKEVIAWAEKIL